MKILLMLLLSFSIYCNDYSRIYIAVLNKDDYNSVDKIGYYDNFFDIFNFLEYDDHERINGKNPIFIDDKLVSEYLSCYKKNEVVKVRSDTYKDNFGLIIFGDELDVHDYKTGYPSKKLNQKIKNAKECKYKEKKENLGISYFDKHKNYFSYGDVLVSNDNKVVKIDTWDRDRSCILFSTNNYSSSIIIRYDDEGKVEKFVLSIKNNVGIDTVIYYNNSIIIENHKFEENISVMKEYVKNKDMYKEIKLKDNKEFKIYPFLIAAKVDTTKSELNLGLSEIDGIKEAYIGEKKMYRLNSISSGNYELTVGDLEIEVKEGKLVKWN